MASKKLCQIAATAIAVLVFCASMVGIARAASTPSTSESSTDSRAIATSAIDMPLEEYAEEHGGIFSTASAGAQESGATAVTDNGSKAAYIPATANNAAGVPAEATVPGSAVGRAASGVMTIETDISNDANSLVIARDNRVVVSDTYAYPYSAIAYMEVHASCGCDWTSTGFMVGRDVLLTGSHCICCSIHHKSADSIALYFGYHPDGSYEYGYFGPTTYWYGTDFSGKNTIETRGWDYGIVKLYENVGDYTGYFGLKARPDKEVENGYFQIAGYRDGVMKYDVGYTSVESDRVIVHYIDAIAGNSGAPMFDGEYYVTGIHVAEDTNLGVNIACRITKDLIKLIKDTEG